MAAWRAPTDGMGSRAVVQFSCVPSDDVRQLEYISDTYEHIVSSTTRS